MKAVFSIIIPLFLITSCENNTNENKQSQSIKRLYWLEGNWKTVTGNVQMIESWKVINEHLMSGHSYSTNGKDTVFNEDITLQQNGEQLFYIPLVKDQNNAEPVTFLFKEYRDGEFIFENEGHDFPQRIIYKHPQPDMLCARIEGMVNGKLKTEDFNFVRIKD